MSESIFSPGKIFKAINGVMSDIGAIQKNDENTYDRYKYRGIDAVYNAIQPALIKNEVMIVPILKDIEQTDRVTKKGEPCVHTRVTVEYRITATDGSFITAMFPGEAIDRSDKSINKAMTAAFKYLLFELFCIPTEDLNDADKESPEAGTKMELPKEDDAESPLSESQIAKLRDMVEKTGLPYEYALDVVGAKGIPTKLQANRIATNLDRIAEKYRSDNA